LILYQVEQGIARITLNRPEKRNALNPELIAELKKAVQGSDRLILLSGAGNDFCSGADLSGLPATSDNISDGTWVTLAARTSFPIKRFSCRGMRMKD